MNNSSICPSCTHPWSRHANRGSAYCCNSKDIDASGNWDSCGCGEHPPKTNSPEHNLSICPAQTEYHQKQLNDLLAKGAMEPATKVRLRYEIHEDDLTGTCTVDPKRVEFQDDGTITVIIDALAPNPFAAINEHMLNEFVEVVEDFKWMCRANPSCQAGLIENCKCQKCMLEKLNKILKTIKRHLNLEH